MLETLYQVSHVVGEVADLIWRLLITISVVVLINDRSDRGK